MTKKNDQTLILTTDEHLGERHAQGIEELLAAFGDGDLDRVRSALHLLSASENVSLDTRVLDMTRDFHARIQAFKDWLSASSITMTTTNIPDAARKLEEVMKSTSEATHKLFGMIERLEGLLSQHREAFETVRTKLEGSLPPKCDDALSHYAQSHCKFDQETKVLLGEMVISQEFQDLCGQSLGKVLKLIKGVESEVGQLMQRFGIHIDPNRAAASDGAPLVQDGVDDILKQFGF